jgi:hypothetical protein
MQNAETVLDVLQSPESPVHRKGARWVRRKAARKRPTPDHREWDLAAQPILLLQVVGARKSAHLVPWSSMRLIDPCFWSRSGAPTCVRLP